MKRCNAWKKWVLIYLSVKMGGYCGVSKPESKGCGRGGLHRVLVRVTIMAFSFVRGQNHHDSIFNPPSISSPPPILHLMIVLLYDPYSSLTSRLFNELSAWTGGGWVAATICSSHPNAQLSLRQKNYSGGRRWGKHQTVSFIPLRFSQIPFTGSL